MQKQTKTPLAIAALIGGAIGAGGQGYIAKTAPTEVLPVVAEQVLEPAEPVIKVVRYEDAKDRVDKFLAEDNGLARNTTNGEFSAYFKSTQSKLTSCLARVSEVEQASNKLIVKYKELAASSARASTQSQVQEYYSR